MPVSQTSLSFDASSARLLRTGALERLVTAVRLVSPDRAALLGRLGVRTVRDELYKVPYRHLDFSDVTSVAQARIGDEVTVVATIDKVELKRPRPRMTVVEVSAFDESAVVVVTYFGQPWLAERFRRGQRVAFSGKMGFSYGFKRMNSPFHDLVSEAEDASAPTAPAKARVTMLPLHHTTEGLSQQWARRIASCALEDFGGVCDFWGARQRSSRGLMPLARALRAAHFPRDAEEALAARERLAYDEAALLQIALVARRDASLPGVHPTAHAVGGPAAARLRAAMPFELTEDQRGAVEDILGDMARDRPMNRLLLGDVGTGKTAVATYALGAVADTGTQAAVMAPTGVLAAQYADKVGPLLDAAGISWALLTGATPARERRACLEGLRSGALSVLFGTHALLTEDVVFDDLSLVVIDEQQRFGVEQRHALREKGRGADLLVMTATPIPRTLALSIYGDLDCSYLRARPVAGAGVSTKVIRKRDRADAYAAIASALEEGRQAYVICPLVGTKAGRVQEDGSVEDGAARALEAGDDPSDAKAAEREAEVLQRKVFPQARVGLLTGRMRPDEKARVMAAFKEGEIDVLVSTTVVEVGVDVPNATVMLIEDGERFGLAQLHQLRGRVGRGRHPGTVYIAADTKSAAARARMAALERTSDGFELAEEDLRLRHEGNILGRQQSGEALLRFVDFSRDRELIEAAHADVARLLGEDPHLEDPANAPVRAEVIRVYGDVFREVGGG